MEDTNGKRGRGGRRLKADLPRQTCERCDRDFQPYRQGQRFCSAYCRTRWWNAEHASRLHACPYCGLHHMAAGVPEPAAIVPH